MNLNDCNMMTTPQLFMLVIETTDGFMAIGSRKIAQFELNAVVEDFDCWSLEGKNRIPIGPSSVDINGTVYSLITVIQSTRTGAIFSLIQALDAEERQEEEAKKRSADLARFGGEIDEELVKKIVRWRKKRDKQKDVPVTYDWEEYYDPYDHSIRD